MSDRQKIIKGLEQFKADFKPFCGNGSDWARVDDAINMLKEQEAKAKWIYCEDEYGQDGYKCSKCGFFVPWFYDFEAINFINDYKLCPSCGKIMEGSSVGEVG